MTTVSELLSWVKQRYQITTADVDTVLLSMISDNQQKRTKAKTWKEALVEDYSTTLASTNQYIELPNDFFAIEENSVRYYTQQDSNPSNGAQPLPVITEEQVGVWKDLPAFYGPQVCAIVGGGTNASHRRILLLPQFTSSSAVLTYDYRRSSTATASTADTLLVPELAEVIGYDTLRDYAVLRNNMEGAQTYAQMAREEYRSAYRTIATG